MYQAELRKHESHGYEPTAKRMRLNDHTFRVSFQDLQDYLFGVTKESDKVVRPRNQEICHLTKDMPNMVRLCLSRVPGTGYGIQATQTMPVGAWIGPYEGNFLEPDKASELADSSYLWEIFKDGKLYGYIDGSDESSSSWMRFIRCARHKEEQNLYAFQYMNKIYYRTYKTIEPGQELLVWYDQMYAQYMGIPCEGSYDMASENASTCHLSKPLVKIAGDKLPLTPPITPTKSPDDPFSRQSLDVSPTSKSSASTVLSGSRSPGSSLQPIRRLEFQGDPMIANQNDTRERTFSHQPIRRLEFQGELMIANQNDTGERSLSLQPIRRLEFQGDPMIANQNDTRERTLNRQPIKIDDPQRSPNQKTDMQIPFTSIPLSMNGDTRMASVLQSSGLPTNTNEKNGSSFTAFNVSNSSPPPISVNLGTAQPQSEPEVTQFQCGQCKQVFIQRSILQTHICTGVLLKPYQCGHCSETFSNPGLMRLHAVTHQGKKPFKCGYCMRSFSGATTLNNHIRTHTGEKPFDCLKCGKSFTKGLQLSRHQKMPGDCAP